jgi:hypothetical protein
MDAREVTSSEDDAVEEEDDDDPLAVDCLLVLLG